MIQVKWLHNGPGHGHGHFAGDVSMLTDQEAERLRSLSIVLIVPDTITVNPPALSPYVGKTKIHTR